MVFNSLFTTIAINLIYYSLCNRSSIMGVAALGPGSVLLQSKITQVWDCCFGNIVAPVRPCGAHTHCACAHGNNRHVKGVYSTVAAADHQAVWHGWNNTHSKVCFVSCECVLTGVCLLPKAVVTVHRQCTMVWEHPSLARYCARSRTTQWFCVAGRTVARKQVRTILTYMGVPYTTHSLYVHVNQLYHT